MGAIPPSQQLSLAETAGRKAGEGDSTGNDELSLVPSPVKINRIPKFVLQNPAARAGPRLSYTKPETVRRDGSNEVAWAFNESLLALLFTHHRFLLNRSIAAGRARARPIRKFALLDRVDFMVVGKVLGGKPAQDFVYLLL